MPKILGGCSSGASSFTSLSGISVPSKLGSAPPLAISARASSPPLAVSGFTVAPSSTPLRTPPLCRNVISFTRFSLPLRAFGIRKPLQRFLQNVAVVSRRLGQQVAASANYHRMHKMLMQVIHKLQHAILQRGGNAKIIKDRQMLHKLAQTNPPSVG